MVAPDPAASPARPSAPSAPGRAARLGSLAAGVCLILAAVATLAASAGLASLAAGLRATWGTSFTILQVVAVLCAALSLRAALLVLPAARGGELYLGAAQARAFLIVAVGAPALYLLRLQPFEVQTALALALLAGGGFALWALLLARFGPPRSKLRRGLGALAFALAVTGLGLELALRAVAASTPHPLLAEGGGNARAFLDAWRLVPGEPRYRFPVNSRGDYDYEWHGAEPDQRLVVCIGDSFSTSTVPLPLHFTSVAERRCENLEVYNMGAPGIGPPEYFLLLQEEALPMRPDLVVVNLFVGNDLRFRSPQPLDVPRLRAWLDADQVVLCRLTKRLNALAAERRRQGGAAIGVAQGAVGEGELVETPEAAHAAFPFTIDPSLERQMFSEVEFLRIETGRAIVCEVAGPPYDTLAEVLDGMLQMADKTPLAIFLIPDEFQVNDELWALVEPGWTGRELERHRPQRLVREWCQANGVDLIDPLPALLAAEDNAGGTRRTFHVRDTHWNALGNRLAGEVLGEYLCERFALPAR